MQQVRQLRIIDQAERKRLESRISSKRRPATRRRRLAVPWWIVQEETGGNEGGLFSRDCLRRDPEIYVMSGNGVLNAFAASTIGYDFIVIHSELFSNTYEKNKDALAFIIGHEFGHLRLGHTRLWYQLSTTYVDRVPLLGDFLSRAREYSCDRHGAYVAPQGEEGLVLLAAGRYVYKQVDTEELLEQAQQFRGLWPTLAQLPQSHPFVVRRIRALYDLGFFEAPAEKLRSEGVVGAES